MRFTAVVAIGVIIVFGLAVGFTVGYTDAIQHIVSLMSGGTPRPYWMF